jgi:enoyl-CoA hydratase/carnithine racemase
MIDRRLMRFMMSTFLTPGLANGSMWLELRSIVESISASDARVIVLSSTSEKFFTAGLDCMSPLLYWADE